MVDTVSTILGAKVCSSRKRSRKWEEKETEEEQMKTLSQMERGLSNRLAYRRTELRGRDIARFDVGTR